MTSSASSVHEAPADAEPGGAAPALESNEARVAVDDRVELDCGSFSLEGPRVLLTGSAGALVGALSRIPGSALARPQPGAWLRTEGVARVASGRLTVAGHDVGRGEHHAAVGVASCGAPLPPDAHPLEWIRTCGELAGLPSRALASLAEAWAGRLFVPTERRARLGMLSALDRRLTCLCAALIADPAVLLVEEPLEGLESATGRGPSPVEALLGALAIASEGRTTIVWARRVHPGATSWPLAVGATDVAVFEDGRVELAARAREVIGTGSAFSLVVLEGEVALRGELTRSGLRVVGPAERPTVLAPPGTRVATILSCAQRAGAALARVRPLLG